MLLIFLPLWMNIFLPTYIGSYLGSVKESKKVYLNELITMGFNGWCKFKRSNSFSHHCGAYLVIKLLHLNSFYCCCWKYFEYKGALCVPYIIPILPFFMFIYVQFFFTMIILLIKKISTFKFIGGFFLTKWNTPIFFP